MVYLLIYMIMKIIDSSLDMISDRISSINEAKALNNSMKASNATLEVEQKAAILEEYINASSDLRIINKHDWWRLISGNWMIWYNVMSLKSGTDKWVWVVKSFDKDANVVFQPYGSKYTEPLGKLTADWVKRIDRTQA